MSTRKKSYLALGDGWLLDDRTYDGCQMEGVPTWREANAIIARNCKAVGARLARIHDTFSGNESAYLCLGIEPTLEGATAIAGLFNSEHKKIPANNSIR